MRVLCVITRNKTDTKDRKNTLFEENYFPVIDLNLFNKFAREIFKLCHLRHL